jgi:restriction endonuclease Mrr
VTQDTFTCKRYSEKSHVGVGIVRSFFGVVNDVGATKGVVVTTPFFTKQAHDISSRNKTRLALMDYDEVASWLKRMDEKDA